MCTFFPVVEFIEAEMASRDQTHNHESNIVSLHSNKIWYKNCLFYIVMEYFYSDLHVFFDKLQAPID